MTDHENNQVYSTLQSLIGFRGTRLEIDEKLSTLFQCTVKVEEFELNSDKDRVDDQLLFEINNPIADLAIDVDLWYIKTKAGHYYITEANFNNQ